MTASLLPLRGVQRLAAGWLLAAQRRPHAAGRAVQRGFTAIELVMAMGVFAVGVTGIFAMQTVVTKTYQEAKDVAVATHLAETWQEQLAIDALRWNNLTNASVWLQAPSGAWTFPAENVPTNLGPGFSALGDYAALDGDDVVYCTHIRLTPVIDGIGSGMVRSEVRVFWPRSDQTGWATGEDHDFNYCQAAALDDIFADDFHFIYKTSILRTPGRN